MEIRATEAADLRVGVGEQAALQQRIVGEVDTRHDTRSIVHLTAGMREIEMASTATGNRFKSLWQ